MLMIVTFLILFARFPHIISSSRTCVPNSHIFLNGKLCQCDSFGSWRTSDCYSVGRRQTCQPGHVAIQGCVRCICQEHGQYSCMEQESVVGQPSINENLAKTTPWCNSFRTYYIDCNICVCPASGKSLEARCAVDVSCSLPQEPSTAEICARKIRCIPTVIYLFHCLHCLCPDDGHFDFEKCVERCERRQSISRSCVPGTIYKKGCNVCVCPNNSIEDDSHCTNNSCKNDTTNNALRKYKKKLMKCNPHEFLKPKCIYCDCNNDGKIDKNTCIEQQCLNSDVPVKDTCNQGETVQFCEECLCPRSGTTTDEYCTRKCSYDSKLELIKTIIALPNHYLIIDKTIIKRITGNQFCKPNSVYVDENQMCICPENGNTSLKLCAEIESKTIELNKIGKMQSKINYNGTCEPGTFVDFDCNSCFCSKKGKIDPKWCTYDDCEAKRVIKESHKLYPKLPGTTLLNITCIPGSISIKECNFCICTKSGLTEDKVCTKIDCSTLNKQQIYNNFTCEPLTYYEVDCNVCFCAKDGIKNLAKCTKNLCENTFLRTELCVAGQLFNDECNVCICPPNGNKSDKVCTNNTCCEASAPWKRIFHLSQTLVGNHIEEYDDVSERILDLCYPGEEFVDGCMICICPDVGLRIYAECSPDFCEEKKNSFQHDHEVSGTDRDKSNSNRKSGTVKYRKLNTSRESCMTPKFSGTSSRNNCKPNSTYIVRCRECICPPRGDVNYFCRPLPDNFKCDQAFRNYNATESKMPSNESEEIVTTLKVGDTTFIANSANTLFIIPPMKILHEHTTYKCNKVANIMDTCFQCECNGSSLIYQHCFQSNAKHCEGMTPSFLQEDVNFNSSKYDFT